MGMPVVTVPEQVNPDPDFSTVRVPNPEEADALSMAVALAKKVNAAVVIGTDPDCDRMGVAVRNDKGEFVKVAGDYRVCNVQVLDKKTGLYQPLDLKKTYTLGGIDYTITYCGDGFTMFKDSKVLKAESRDVGTAAHRDENLVPADPLGVALRILIDNGVALDSGDLALEAEVHATFGVDLLKHSADLIVKRSENLRKHLNHSHFRTESAIESRELHSDDTSTDDNELGRTLFQRKDLTVGDDNVSGLLQTRERRHGSL